MRWKNKELELNQLSTSLQIFLESYNQKIPTGYPRASVASLKKFQVAFPMLFKKSDEWSIGKHRKKLMDWLSSNRDI